MSRKVKQPFIQAGVNYYAPLFGHTPVLVRVLGVYGDSDVEVEALETHQDWDGVPQEPGTVWSYELKRAVKEFQLAAPRPAPPPPAPSVRPAPALTLLPAVVVPAPPGVPQGGAGRPPARTPRPRAPRPRPPRPPSGEIKTELPGLMARVAAAPPRRPLPPPPRPPAPRPLPSPVVTPAPVGMRPPRRFGPARPAVAGGSGAAREWEQRVGDVQGAACTILAKLNEGALSRAQVDRVKAVVRHSLERNDDSDEAFRAVLLDLPAPRRTIGLPGPAQATRIPRIAPPPVVAPVARPAPRAPAPRAPAPRPGQRWIARYAGIEFAGIVSEVLRAQVLLTTDSGSPVYVPTPALVAEIPHESSDELEPVPF